MDFVELHTEFVRLRQSLRTFVGEDALSEISVQTPVDDDEASFLRLIAWSYVLVFEAGRVTIPYLLKLPSEVYRPQADLEAACDLVHDLRTWSFHNLSFFDERELGISKRTVLWFIRNSGTNPPNDIDGWRSCFECLCTEIYAIVAHCRSAVEFVLAESKDGGKVVDDLRRRLDRNWPAYRFDAMASDAATRIGQKLDVPKFRQTRLVKWREYVETIPVGDDPEALVVRLIERDVLDHFGSVLPINGNDVMLALDLSPGPEVGDALNNARRLYGSGVIDPDRLLASLRQEYHPRRESLSTDVDSERGICIEST